MRAFVVTAAAAVLPVAMLAGCGSSPLAKTATGNAPTQIVLACTESASRIPAGADPSSLPDQASCAVPPNGGPTVSLAGPAGPQHYDNGPGVAVSADGHEQVQLDGGYQVGSTTIWLADDTGGHRKKLWRFKGLAVSLPSWSPDATEVALTAAPEIGESYDCAEPSAPGNVKTGLWVIDAANGRARMVASAACGPVAWAPNGKKLALFIPGDRARIEIVSAGGGTPEELYRFPQPLGTNENAEGLGSLSWSPDGRSILVDIPRVGRNQLIRLSPDGGPAVPLAPAPPGTVDWGAVYSPTGHQLAVLQGLPPNADSSSVLTVTDQDGHPIRTLNAHESEPRPAELAWTLQPANVQQSVAAPTPTTTTTTVPRPGGTPPTTRTPPGGPVPSVVQPAQ